MQKFPYVLSEYEEINSLLFKPINSTQRIKYTCFNVSPNYIILGSTSGSIYLFSRNPCTFLQLIPLTQGAVSCVLVSPDEKVIALATVRGTVSLVALKPSPKLIGISSEHVDEQINCLCWNDNSSEVYIGDCNGKISVMVLSIFTVNGMFQVPSCTLMNLDSAIVQLSFSAPLLLVSTLTRCYICETVQEQYKQIGNKRRNGEFGACFYKTRFSAASSNSVTQKDEKLTNRKHLFNLIPEDNSNVQLDDMPQIFCARPGSRLWEVSANGVVTKTHQFKEALAVPPAEICRSSVGKSVYLKRSEETWSPQSINFSHLFVVAEKYLFSYTSSGLYVIDPLTATVVLWNNEFSNVTMAETIENKIYLMTSNGEFHCLMLSPLDVLIVQLYDRKKYEDCMEICIAHKTELQKFVDGTEIDNMCNKENELQTTELRDDERFALLHPLMLLLESNTKTSPKKLLSGIVVVNSGNSGSKGEENFRHKIASHGSSQCNESFRRTELKMEPKVSTPKETEDANCNTEKEAVKYRDEVWETENEFHSSRSLTHKIQTDLQDIYSLVENIRPSMNEEELEKVILDVNWRMNVIKDSYESLTDLKSFVYEILRSAELYYFNTLLENAPIDLIQSTDNEHVTKQITTSFVSLNAQCCRRCTCGVPCPTNELAEPKFLEIGRSLLKRFANESKDRCVGLCNQVPYMWRDYLPTHVERRGAPTNDALYQCLQIRDSVALSILLPSLSDKQWDLVAACVKKMQDGKCLLCGKPTKIGKDEASIQWTAVITEIMRKRGSDVAVAVLTNLERSVPNDIDIDIDIDKSIFQSLVFTKILHKHGMKHAVNFNQNAPELSEYNTVCSLNVRDRLIEALEKDLSRSINKNVFGNGAHHWGMQYKDKSSSTCPCCTLSLQTPVLLGNNGIAIFGCGHAYHVNCMIEKKLTTCNLHS